MKLGVIVFVLIVLLYLLSACSASLPPASPTGVFSLVETDHYKIMWRDRSDNEVGFKIYRKLKSGRMIEFGTPNKNATVYRDFDIDVPNFSEHCVAAFNEYGMSEAVCVSDYGLPPTPSPNPDPEPNPEPDPDPPSYCCKVCTKGKPCGDTCINVNYTCHEGPGCACSVGTFYSRGGSYCELLQLKTLGLVVD